MDCSGNQENIYQSRNPIVKSCKKSTYLTTYEQFLSSQFRPSQQVQDEQLNEIFLLDNVTQKQQTSSSDCNQIKSLNEEHLLQNNNGKQKLIETDSNFFNLSLKSTNQPLCRNLQQNEKNYELVLDINQATATDGVASVSHNESFTELDNELVTAYECKICSFETIYEGVFKEHLLTHKRKETFHKCPKCDFKMKCRASIKKHMTIDNQCGDLAYCGLYSYSSKCKGELALHLNAHGNDRDGHVKMEHSYMSQ